jgi:acetamidase/formamidase
MSKHYELASSPKTVHWGYFDAALEPQLVVESGDSVTLHCVSGGPEEMPESGRGVLAEHRAIHEQLKPRMRGHILTGPIGVRGAVPGDALEVRIHSVELRTDWGYNVQRPLLGTLPEDFPQLTRMHIPIDRTRRVATLPWGTELALAPFFGIMGVAPPPSYGAVSSIEPREYGGNIDCKELVAGTTLLLPVWADGALFSAGDGHGVQGDGEVCLTALETCLSGRFELILHKDFGLRAPRALTASHYITFGFDPDLDDAAKHALRDMIKLIGELTDLSATRAYTLCSLACDLRVTQLVDGNKGIHAMLPRSALSRARDYPSAAVWTPGR